MKLNHTIIPGCYEILLPASRDTRGSFLKGFQSSAFASHKLETHFAETFHTISHSNVLRGMHLQLPPADHAKVVYCVSGAVMDVVLDVRRGSPSFHRHVVFELSAARANAVYVPRGLAHGFYVLEAPAIMLYHVTSEHSPGLDSGIAWNSFGCPWPNPNPVVSVRDSDLRPLHDFDTPFHYPGPAD